MREAGSALQAAEARLASTRNEIGSELHQRKLALERALETASILKQDVLPRVEATLRGSEARYTAGDISLAELLQVRRDAAAARLDYLEAIRLLMDSWASLASGRQLIN